MAICPECGSVVPDGKRFCSNCGARIDAAVVRAAPERATRPPSDGGHAVGQSTRAQTQGRKIQPFDEKRPLPDENGQSKRANAPQAESERSSRDWQARVMAFDQRQTAWDSPEEREQHEKPGREMPPMFDDDEYYGVKKAKSARNEEEVRPKPHPSQVRPMQKRPGPMPVLKPGECLLCILLAILPVIGLAVGILWARRSKNPNKRNLSIAMVVFNAAEIILGAIAFVLIAWVL